MHPILLSCVAGNAQQAKDLSPLPIQQIEIGTASAATGKISDAFMLRQKFLPAALKNGVRAIYEDVVSYVVISGINVGAIPCSVGIKQQGCPASGMLFVLASDVVMR